MIRINDMYTIDVDDMNYTLYAIGTYGEKSKNAGEEKQTVIGYYNTLEGAIEACRNDYMRKVIGSKDMGLDEAVTAIKRISDEFRLWAKVF